jgi:hypothetical protein
VVCGVREAAACRQGVGAVLVGADLLQAAADRGPADAPDRERDFADGHDIADGQFPGRFSRVAEPRPCGCIWLILWRSRHRCHVRLDLLAEWEH